MSRTTKNVAEYFPHYAQQRKTLFILKSRFQNNGYAFWFQLLELLCAAENHYYDCRNNEEWLYLCSYCGSNAITGTEIVDLLASLGNIDKELWEKKIIWCENLVKNLEPVYTKRGRELPSKPIIDTSNAIIVTCYAFSDSRSTQSKVKQSKAKQSKEEQRGMGENIDDAALRNSLFAFKQEERYKNIDFEKLYQKMLKENGIEPISNPNGMCLTWLKNAMQFHDCDVEPEKHPETGSKPDKFRQGKYGGAVKI
jgi:hypothetical protein